MAQKVKSKRVGMSGDQAVAYAAKQANVDAVVAFPITPQTIIVERLSDYVFNGELDAAFIPVESEHSAMSACIGAALTGGRTFTATASQGLALMYEILYIASSMRLPIVMAIGNRAFSAPINIHCSHDDAYAARDAGWISFFAENVQEAYDLIFPAFKIAENKNILLPAIVNLDAFILTHSVEGLNVFMDDDIPKFLPPRDPVYPIDFNDPKTYGPFAMFDYYMELKRQQEEAMYLANDVIKDTLKEFSEFSGRKYKPIKTYGLDDAEGAVIVLGSIAGTMRTFAKKARESGKKVGVISLTQYRPFPVDELRKIVKGLKALAVMDRSISFGSPGAQLYMDVTSALYNMKDRPLVYNIIYGLGGRELPIKDIEKIFDDVIDVAKKGEVTKEKVWMGLRE